MTPLDDPHDGNTMTQIREGHPVHLMTVETGADGAARVARALRVATAMMNYGVRRQYKIKSNGNVAFFYSVQGNLDKSTLEHLNAISEMLHTVFQMDYELHFNELEAVMVNELSTRVSLKHSLVYMYFELKFGRQWVAADGFEKLEEDKEQEFNSEERL